jgi:hypothetical protein
MFSIDVSWHEQDEVRDPVLHQTWGMLRITVNDEIVTAYANKLSRAIQEGPSVSVFPMARYLVSNWWRLTNESLADERMLASPGRRSLTVEPWLRAHNLFYSREGMAYPDLALYSVDRRIGIKYAKWASPHLSGSFLAEGTALLPAKPVIDELARFMDQVYLRLKDLPPPARASDEVNEVLERWQFIRDCSDEQRRLGRRLAMFGIEPFEESVTEELEQEILGLSLDESLVTDLLSAVAEDVGAVSNAALRARLLEQALSKVPPAGPEFRALRESAEEARGELESAHRQHVAELLRRSSDVYELAEPRNWSFHNGNCSRNRRSFS